MHMRKIVFFSSLQLFAFIAFAQTAPDASVIEKIKKEGVENSKVMDIAFQLTDVSGPRLTASPNFMKAANWAKNTLTGRGLENAQLEPWGEFGKGWELEKSYVAMTAPYYKPLIAFPKVWTAGTNGLQKGEVVVIIGPDGAGTGRAGSPRNRDQAAWMLSSGRRSSTASTRP